METCWNVTIQRLPPINFGFSNEKFIYPYLILFLKKKQKNELAGDLILKGFNVETSVSVSTFLARDFHRKTSICWLWQKNGDVYVICAYDLLSQTCRTEMKFSLENKQH